MNSKLLRQISQRTLLFLVIISLSELGPRRGFAAETNLPTKKLNAANSSAHNWNEINNKLPDVNFDAIPIREVAKFLSKEFQHQFDVLLPNQGVASTIVDETFVTVRLKNVNASEVFNAMNLIFDSSHAPLRWQLVVNGSRPTAVLGATVEIQRPLDETRRAIFFVGDLLGSGNEKETQLKWVEVFETIQVVLETAFREGRPNISSHSKAQLLIVSGKPEQIELVRQTLDALKLKVSVDERKRHEAAVKSVSERLGSKEFESKAKTVEPKGQ